MISKEDFCMMKRVPGTQFGVFLHQHVDKCCWVTESVLRAVGGLFSGDRMRCCPGGCIFSSRFFSRICMKKIHECETLYLVNKIEFGNYDAGFVMPTPTLSWPKSFRSIRSFFQTRGYFGVIPAVCVFTDSPPDIDKPRWNPSTTDFFFFFTEQHHYGKGWWDWTFKDCGGMGKIGFSSEPA